MRKEEQNKRRRKILSLLLAVCMVLAMMPATSQTVWAAGSDTDIVSAINAYNSSSGGTGSLTATVSDGGDTVTIGGTAIGVTTPLELAINSGVTVVWRASLTNSENFSDRLVKISGSGTFEMAEGEIRNIGTLIDGYSYNAGALFSVSTDIDVRISGGTLSSVRSSAVYLYDCGVTVTGGKITGNSGISCGGREIFVGGQAEIEVDTIGITAFSNDSVVRVTGGTITSEQGSAIHITNSNVPVEISGGIIQSTGTAVEVKGPLTITGSAVLRSYGNTHSTINKLTGNITIGGNAVISSKNSTAISCASTEYSGNIIVTGSAVISAGGISGGSAGRAIVVNEINNPKMTIGGEAEISGEADNYSIISAPEVIVTGGEVNASGSTSTAISGKRITVTGSGIVNNTGNGGKTIVSTDTLIGGNGKVTATGQDATALSITNLTMESGFVNAEGFSSTAIKSAGSTRSSIEIVDGEVTVESGYGIYNSGDGDVSVAGGRIKAGSGYAIYNFLDGHITVSGDAEVENTSDVTATIYQQSIEARNNYTNAILIEGGIVKNSGVGPVISFNLGSNPENYTRGGTVSGGAVLGRGTMLEDIVTNMAIIASGVAIAVADEAAVSQTEGSSTSLSAWGESSTAAAFWAKEYGVAGITNNVNGILVPMPGFQIKSAPRSTDFTPPAALTYDGTPKAYTKPADMNAIIFYEGTVATDYPKSSAAPSGAGTYAVTADVTGNAGYSEAQGLSIGSMTITPASYTGAAPTLTQKVIVGVSYTYHVSLSGLHPEISSGTTLGAMFYELGTETGGDTILSTPPAIHGDSMILTSSVITTSGAVAMVGVTLKTQNYGDVPATVVLETTADKIPISIGGITVQNGIYEGTPHSGYAGAASSDQYTGPWDCSYEGREGTTHADSSTAPINAGSYRLTISVPTINAIYEGTMTQDFVIEKRPITIKAVDKTMTRGGALPALTYQVDGQLTGETALVTVPTLTCSAVDVNTAGTYSITVDMTSVEYSGNYKAASPAAISGTLTVSNPPSGNGSNSGSSGSTQTPAPSTELSGSTAGTTTEATVGSDGKATSPVTAAQMSDALAKAAEASKKTGGEAMVQINVTGASSAKLVETTVPMESVRALVSGNVGGLTVSSPLASVTFDGESLDSISRAAAGDVSFTASRADVSSLPAAVRQLLGNRPVYEFSVTSGGRAITQFGGSVTVAVPYTPAAGEDPNAVILSYINADGNLEIVTNGRYDTATGTVVFTTDHFSQYAVGYNKVSFRDVKERAWYADAVSFLAAREITGGTGNGNFSPNDKLTRGQFLVLLMKAYGIDPDSTTSDNFSDAGNTYYTGYLAAAKRLGISSGVGDNLFAPKKAITRQETFTLLYNALEIIGQFPAEHAGQHPAESAGRTLADFADSGKVASYALEPMGYLIKAGIVNGSGSLLSPTSITNRAQMAQVLYQLLSI